MNNIALYTLKQSGRGNITFQTIMDPNSEVFFRKSQGLYLWMFREQFLSLLEKCSSEKDYFKYIDRIKFGQYGADAKDGSTPQDTINGYVGTTTDSIVILWAVRLTDEQIKNIGNSKTIEKKVGTVNNLGPKNKFGSSIEVFETSIERVVEKVNDTLYPHRMHGFFDVTKKTYQPRLRQEEAINNFGEYHQENIQAGPINFLLAAVPRYGKNFTFLEMARMVVPYNGNVLVITGRPDVFESLRDDVTSHINYDGWVYDELKEKQYKWKPSSDRVNVLAVSTQLLSNKSHRRKLAKHLSQFNWDIRGIDEADTTMLTELSAEILDKLKSPVSIWITGTWWKLLSTGLFTDKNIYNYDYIQQQKDKKAGIDPRAVTLDFYTLDVLDDIKEQKKWYTDTEGFTLKKLFSFNEETGQFIHETDIVMFLKSVFGIIPKTSFSPYKIIPELQHTFWVLPPSTKAVIRLKYLIEKVTAGEIEVFAATGNEVDDITEVKNFLKWNKNKKSVVLSINRFTRGTTIPEWDATFFMNETESAESYFQAAFRPTSPTENKDKGYVFDFNPNRALIMVAEYARQSAQQQGITDPHLIIREFLDNFNIFGVAGGVEFRRKTLEEVLNAVRESDYNADTLKKSGSHYIKLDNISEVLLEKIMGLDKETSKRLKLKITSSDGIMKKGKNYNTTSAPKNRQFNKEKKDIIARISTLISRLPIICELGYSTVEDIVENLPDELFYGATKSDKEILRMLVEEKIIDTYKINLQLR